MGTNKLLAGPAYLGAAAANVFNEPTAGITTTVRHIHVANVTSGPVSLTLWLGATGASAGGTEIEKDRVIEANKSYDYQGELEMSSTKFLVGKASVASSLVAVVEGVQRVI